MLCKFAFMKAFQSWALHIFKTRALRNPLIFSKEDSFRWLLILHCLLMFHRAESIYQSMKSVYGTNACHMLQINSVSNSGSNPLPNLPDPWSQFIIPTSEDTLVSLLMICSSLTLSGWHVCLYSILLQVGNLGEKQRRTDPWSLNKYSHFSVQTRNI